MEDTHATRTLMSRSHHLADGEDSPPAASVRVASGTGAPGRSLSGLWQPHSARAEPLPPHTVGCALGPLAGTAYGAGPPVLWRGCALSPAELRGAMPTRVSPVGAPRGDGGAARVPARRCDESRHTPPPPARGTEQPAHASRLGRGGVRAPAGAHFCHLAGGLGTPAAGGGARGPHRRAPDAVEAGPWLRDELRP
jgi:hypothetical protein